ERKMGDVDQPRRARDILLHEVDQAGAPGDEFCARVVRNLAHGVGDVACARISEIVHRFAPVDFSMALPNMTSSMAPRCWDTRRTGGYCRSPFIGGARLALGDQAGGGTDPAGSAVAALKGVMLDEGLLQRVKRPSLRQAFDRRDPRAILHDRQREA